MAYQDRPMDDGTARDRTMVREDAGEGAYQTEHWLAWLLALTAVVLGVIALLRGFGIVGDTSSALTIGGTQVPGTAGGGGSTNPTFDGFVWMLPAIAAGLLSFALHNSDHHRHRDLPETESGMYRTEHLLAYLFALGTIVSGVLALLVGFDVFNRGNSQPDGWLWGTAAITLGVVTNTLHTVRHHQVAAEEDYVAAMMDQRMASTRPSVGMREAREQDNPPLR